MHLWVWVYSMLNMCFPAAASCHYCKECSSVCARSLRGMCSIYLDTLLGFMWWTLWETLLCKGLLWSRGIHVQMGQATHRVLCPCRPRDKYSNIDKQTLLALAVIFTVKYQKNGQWIYHKTYLQRVTVICIALWVQCRRYMSYYLTCR